jgi:hypothetical protein
VAEGTWTDDSGTTHFIDCWWLEESIVTELLKKAGAEEENRADLKRQLEWARFFYYDAIPAKPISAKTYDNVERAAGRLLAALTSLDRQLPFPPSKEELLLVDIDPHLFETLRELRRRAGNSAKAAAKRGQPEKLNKLAVVKVAAGFFRAHSPVKPSNNDPFRDFAERFFNAATGLETAEGSLDWQIRSVLKAKGEAEVNR